MCQLYHIKNKNANNPRNARDGQNSKTTDIFLSY